MEPARWGAVWGDPLMTCLLRVIPVAAGWLWVALPVQLGLVPAFAGDALGQTGVLRGARGCGRKGGFPVAPAAPAATGARGSLCFESALVGAMLRASGQGPPRCCPSAFWAH